MKLMTFQENHCYPDLNFIPKWIILYNKMCIWNLIGKVIVEQNDVKSDML